VFLFAKDANCNRSISICHKERRLYIRNIINTIQLILCCYSSTFIIVHRCDNDTPTGC
jgi:hypothetical protein